MVFLHATQALRRLCAHARLVRAELHVQVAGRSVRIAVEVPAVDGVALSSPVAAGVLHEGGDLYVVAAPDAGAETELARVVDVTAVLLTDLLDADAALVLGAQELATAADLARTDPLTGVGNRRAWEDALTAQTARARRTGLALAVVVIDLDGLKQVNDAHGHAHGDRLLRRAATVLREQARTGDTLCRLGGDEFAVAGLVRADSDATALAGRLRDALMAHEVAASTGAAAARPERGDAEALSLELWQRADLRMYENKNR